MLQNKKEMSYKGSVHENMVMKSRILGRDLKYSIYLPAEYYSMSTRTYQTLYILHGAGGDNNSWLELGKISAVLDDKINKSQLPPMIVVMPDGGTHDDIESKGFYVNSSTGRFNYEDMFMTEFMPFIDENYHTKKGKKHTFIGGNSMGGYGSLYYALKHPDRFKAAFSLGTAILNDEVLVNMKEKMYNQYFGNMIGFGLVAEDRLNNRYRQHNILDLFRSKPDTRDSVKYYIDCGDKDNRGRITEIHMELHCDLVKMDVEHEMRMEDGIHSWDYWRSRIDEALDFVHHHAINK